MKQKLSELLAAIAGLTAAGFFFVPGRTFNQAAACGISLLAAVVFGVIAGHLRDDPPED